MLYEKILIFILFLGPLVFFHELGHFLFARLFGVRVEVFSIGFGPKLLKKKWGGTEYAFSLIPLGGYVKMYGDDPFSKDAVPEEERKFSFTHQNKWARFWIVIGGPLANFILAFFIFYFLLLSGERVPEIKLGAIEKKSILSVNGLKAGDVLVKVNGKEVYNPSDLMIEGITPVTELQIKRRGVIEKLNTKLPGETFFEEVMKHPPFLRKPLVVNKNGEAFFISRIKGKVDQSISLEEVAEGFGNQRTGSIYLYPVAKSEDLSGDEVKLDLNKEQVISFDGDDLNSLLAVLETQGWWSIDLMVKSVNMTSPADKAGIKSGDVFVSIEEKKILSFEEFRMHLQTISKSNISVQVWRSGELKTFVVSPEITKEEGKDVKRLGVYGTIEVIKPQFVLMEKKGIVGSISVAMTRTWDSMSKTFDGFLKLITNQVSLKSIGGPFAIGKVAHDSFKTSLSYFFQLMALISVNLGIINLFPIPVLDGGHIMFIILEVINRGPLSRRKMEIAQQVGLSVLLMLMVGSIFNDVTRFF